MLYGFEVALEVVKDVFEFLHDAISDSQLSAESFELFADFDVIVGGVFLDFLKFPDNGIAHMPEIKFFEVLCVFGEGEEFALNVVGGLLGEGLAEEFRVEEDVVVFGRIIVGTLHLKNWLMGMIIYKVGADDIWLVGKRGWMRCKFK